MSLNIKKNGQLVKVAGSTVILDATASEIRSGTFSLSGTNWLTQNIIFDVPMPDTDYIVNVELASASGNVMTPWRITDKTVNGFTLAIYSNSSITYTGKYYAIRLVKLEGYTELQNKVSNPDSTPTENSTNLVTSGGVYDAILSASKIFINSESAWNELDAETKATYQVAILTDKPNVNAVDSTDGSTTVVGEPNKRWIGTQAEWNNLTAAEKAEFEIVCFTDDNGANGKDIYSTTETKTNKVWIDGKPIYRKVVEKNVTLSGNSWNHTGVDVSEIDTLCNCIMLNSKFAFGGFYTTKSSNQLDVYCVSDANWGVATFILEYTKIAD